MMNLKFWLAVTAMLVNPLACAAGVDVEVAVGGVRSNSGTLRAVLCAPGERFPDACKIASEGPAQVVGSKLMFKNVAQGRYAFALFHDEDNNGRVTMLRPGMPAEGMAFGNDAIGANGLPRFDAAALQVSTPAAYSVKMRYFRR